MSFCKRANAILTRRRFLSGAAGGVGLAALSSLLGAERVLANYRQGSTQFPAKAKSCIFFHMEGGMSQFDLFANKPKLNELHGQRPPDSLLKNARFAFIKKESAVLMGTRRTFQRHGQSGLWFSDLVPNLARHADKICMLNAVQTTQFNHAPAQLLWETGRFLKGHPSMGSWLAYGLGSENENLPAYLVLNSSAYVSAGDSLWASGFLPTSYSGVLLQPSGDPVLSLALPPGISTSVERDGLTSLARLNQLHKTQVMDPEIESRIEAYELAFRMQREVPSLIDLSQESPATTARYGLGRSDPASKVDAARAPAPGVYNNFARHCLLARRMVERGVRFVNVYSGSWDAHQNIDNEVPFFAGMMDQPIAALVSDLAERGLLDQTLVVISSEFGRTPLSEDIRPGVAPGRDHHPNAFNVLMIGGGIKGGLSHGETDEIGWDGTRDVVDISDVHATILRLFGLDHNALTYRYDGLDQRLTPVTRYASAIERILA